MKAAFMLLGSRPSFVLEVYSRQIAVSMFGVCPSCACAVVSTFITGPSNSGKTEIVRCSKDSPAQY